MQEKINVEQYCEILEDRLVESFEELQIPEHKWYFQQDNNLKHTSRWAKKWFSDNKIEVLEWPSQFPDPNPIECTPLGTPQAPTSQV